MVKINILLKSFGSVDAMVMELKNQVIRKSIKLLMYLLFTGLQYGRRYVN